MFNSINANLDVHFHNKRVVIELCIIYKIRLYKWTTLIYKKRKAGRVKTQQSDESR